MLVGVCVCAGEERAELSEKKEVFVRGKSVDEENDRDLANGAAHIKTHSEPLYWDLSR